MKTENRGSRTRDVRSHCVFKLPFGEELFGGPSSAPGVGGRTTTMGYTVSDNVRQKFTQTTKRVRPPILRFLFNLVSALS